MIQRLRLRLKGRKIQRHWRRYEALRAQRPLACQGELYVEGPLPVVAECAAYDERDCGFRRTLHDRSDSTRWAIGSDDMAWLQAEHRRHSLRKAAQR